MPKTKVNDINLYYEIHGAGEPLILISGLAADHYAWVNILPELSKHYQVVVFDNRGIGQSDCPDMPYTIELMANDVVKLCEHLQYKKINIIGSSMGGLIAIALAADYPELIRKAIIANAPYQADIKFSLITEANSLALETEINPKMMIKYNLGWIYSSSFLNQPDMIDKLIHKMMNNPNPITTTGYHSQLNAIASANIDNLLAKITSPCLVIGADQDMIVSSEQSKKMANNIQCSKFYCFKNCGHLPHIERSDEFNKLILKFTSNVSSSRLA